jgi:hypothetical protein
LLSPEALKDHLVQLSRTERPDQTAVGLVSTVQSDSVTDISVDPSSIMHGASSGEILVASASTVQGMNADEVSIAPVTTISKDEMLGLQSKKKDEDAVVTSMNPSSTVQGADMTEMSINLPSSIRAAEHLNDSSHTVEACKMLPYMLSGTMQAEILSEIPIDSSSIEGTTVAEMSIVSSKIPGKAGDKLPIDPLLVGEGETISEVAIVNSQAKDSEIGDRVKMPSDSSRTREENALFEMQIDPSDTGQNQEPRPKKLDNLKAEKQATALENSRSAKPRPISNGPVLLECTSFRSAIFGCNTTPLFQKTSPIWQPLETLELFTRAPQQPHFKKLSRC